MGIPIGNQYTATARGSVWRPVHCEHCGVSFAYLMKRQGVGASNSLLWLRNGTARGDAAAMARASLEAQLEADWDAVPCPACGAFQSSMTYRWRRAHFVNAALALGGLLALCVVTLFVLVVLRAHPPRLVLSALRWASLASSLGVGVAWFWTQRLDPNAQIAQRAGKAAPGVLRSREVYEERVATGRLPPLSWDRPHLAS